MGTTDVNFKLQISIRRSSDDGPIFQKQDGERFESPITVKLNVDTKYTVFFTTRPAMGIRKVVLKGETLEIEQQKKEKNEESSRVYTADWTTEGQDFSKSSSRIYLPFTVEMDDGSHITTKMQIKMYPEQEVTHSKWGQELHLLDMECVQKAGTKFIEVVREQFI